MKSTKYRKFRASKYDHRTRIIKGSSVKGKLVIGIEPARREIETKIGRQLKVHHVEKNKGQWIFCELK